MPNTRSNALPCRFFAVLPRSRTRSGGERVRLRIPSPIHSNRDPFARPISLPARRRRSQLRSAAYPLLLWIQAAKRAEAAVRSAASTASGLGQHQDSPRRKPGLLDAFLTPLRATCAQQKVFVATRYTRIRLNPPVAHLHIRLCRCVRRLVSSQWCVFACSTPITASVHLTLDRRSVP